jgi:hypothetical protein
MNVDDIATTALMFVKQAARYSDRSTFDITEAFDLLFDAIEQFNGTHFRSRRTRQRLAKVVNDALSTIPGNQVSIRCVELSGGSYAIEWLPYMKAWAAKAGWL